MELIATILQALLAIVTLPIGFLNFGGGIVAGIWLIILGQWKLVIAATIGTIVSTWVLGFLMAPTLLLLAPITSKKVQESRFMLPLVFVLGTLSNTWTYGLILLYIVGSFGTILSSYAGGAILPYVLLAYAVAVGPWTYMAQREAGGNNESLGWGTVLPTLSACVASLGMLIQVLITKSLTPAALFHTALILVAIIWAIHIIVILLVFGIYKPKSRYAFEEITESEEEELEA